MLGEIHASDNVHFYACDIYIYIYICKMDQNGTKWTKWWLCASSSSSISSSSSSSSSPSVAAGLGFTPKLSVDPPALACQWNRCVFDAHFRRSHLWLPRIWMNLLTNLVVLMQKSSKPYRFLGCPCPPRRLDPKAFHFCTTCEQLGAA